MLTWVYNEKSKEAEGKANVWFGEEKDNRRSNDAARTCVGRDRETSNMKKPPA